MHPFFDCLVRDYCAGVAGASVGGGAVCPAHFLFGKDSLSKYSVIFGQVSVANFPVSEQTVLRTTVSGIVKSTDLYL